MPVRLATLLAVLMLAFPAGALAQGAGDDQYTDPFGGGQTGGDEEPAPDPDTPTSSDDAPAPAPAATPAPAAPAAEAAAGGQEQLPYTGSEAALLALGGALLLVSGLALRRRLR